MMGHDGTWWDMMGHDGTPEKCGILWKYIIWQCRIILCRWFSHSNNLFVGGPHCHGWCLEDASKLWRISCSWRVDWNSLSRTDSQMEKDQFTPCIIWQHCSQEISYWFLIPINPACISNICVNDLIILCIYIIYVS